MFLASSWPWHSMLFHFLAGVAVATATATFIRLTRRRETADAPAPSAPGTHLPRDQRRRAQLTSITLLGIVVWLPVQSVIPHPACRVDGALLPVGAGLAVFSVAALWSTVAAALVRERGDVPRWLIPTGVTALRWAALAVTIVIIDTLAEGR